MAENPFEPKHFGCGLLATLGSLDGAAKDLFVPLPSFGSALYPLGILGAAADLFPPPAISPYSTSGAIADLLGSPKTTPANALTGAAADLFPTTPPPGSFSALAGLMASPPTFPQTQSFGSLASLAVPPAPSPFNALYNPPPSSPFGSLASLMAAPPPSFAPPSEPARPFGSLADLVAPPAPSPFNALYTPPPKPKPIAPETKRKAFFSFHFDDIMRVNNVRNAWKITHPDSSSNRSFLDSSLWDARKGIGPEGIKQLIRAGVLHTSAVCVLAGSMTWDRRWVRYEIARAIIDGRGLLTVHLNSINHHQTKGPDPRGLNPLAHMGVAKLQPNTRLPPQYYLYEMTQVPDGYGGMIEQWSRYDDYTLAVKKPAWLTDPSVDHVKPLSVDAAEYDYELDHGHRNIGSWIDKAAKQANR